MRVKYRFYLWCLVLVLLLGNCTQRPEQPAPMGSSLAAADPNLQALRQTFQARHFDQQLRQQVDNQNHPNSVWTWTPLWEKASQTTVPDSATYTYVPLEAQLPERPYTVTLVGLRRYLLIKQAGPRFTYSIISYLYGGQKAGAPLQATPENSSRFFRSFTGAVLLKDLATGDHVRWEYRQGIRQPSASVLLLGKSGAAGRTLSCWNDVVCYWTASCPEGGITLGSITTGIDDCSAPASSSSGYDWQCQRFMSWTKTYQEVTPRCDDSGGDPGPGPSSPPNPGNGGGVGPGFPTTDPNSPCGQMATLTTKPGFQAANAAAIAMTQGSVERGYVYRNGGNTAADFEPLRNGGPNEADWPRVAGWQYDGMMHTHPGGLSVFSISDIHAMYRVAAEGYMHDPATFTMLVYTSYGDDYALKITDYNRFLDFAPKIVDEQAILEFEDRYILKSPPLYPFVHYSNSLNEQSLLRILRDFNTGLVLLKHNRTSNTWQQRGLDSNNSPVTNPCQ